MNRRNQIRNHNISNSGHALVERDAAAAKTLSELRLWDRACERGKQVSKVGEGGREREEGRFCPEKGSCGARVIKPKSV